MRILFTFLLAFSTLSTVHAFAGDKDRGLTAFGRQDFESAIPLLQNALRSDPEDREIRLALGLSFLAVDNDPLGIPLLEGLANEQTEAGLKAALALASHHSGQKHPDEALKVLSSAWKLFPGRPEVFRAYAAVLDSLDRKEELLSLLEDPSAPAVTETAQKRISLLLALGRTEAAKSFAESWPEPNGRAELTAWYLRKTGKISEAADTYTELYAATKDPRFATEAGRTWIEAGNPAAAGQLVLKTVQPVSVAIRVLKDLALYDTLIRYYLDLERSTGADQSRELIPLLESVSHWDDLLDRLLRHLETSEDTGFVLPRIADLVFLRDRKESVIIALEKASTNFRDPAAAGRVLLVLAEIQLRAGDRARALDAAQRGLHRTGLADFALRYGNEFNDRGWSSEADRILEDVLAAARKPEDRAEALLSLARIRHENGKSSDALLLLDRLDREYPGLPDPERVRSARARVLADLGRFDEALAVLDRMNQKDPDILLRSSVCLLMTGKSGRALTLCRQAGRGEDRSSEAAVLEGVILLADADRDKAEESFRRAATDPLPSPSSLNGLIELYVLTSVLKGTNGIGAYGRGLADLTAGRYEDAARIFEGFADRNGPNAPFFRYRTGVCLALGRIRTDDAERILGQIAGDAGLPSFIRSHAAEVRADLALSAGRTDEALGFYRDILMKDPRYARQSVIRERINRLKAKEGGP